MEELDSEGRGKRGLANKSVRAQKQSESRASDWKSKSP
jgi:hypothetical protein